MPKKAKEIILKFGIPCLAVITIAIQLFLASSQSLNAWKGGGYGMYTSIHYYYNEIYITGMLVENMIEDNKEMKTTLGRLKLMPNDNNLKTAADLVIKTYDKDSIHIQIWKPAVNSENGVYSRALVNEIHVNNSEL